MRFNIWPPFPMTIPLWDSRSQMIVASMSKIPLSRSVMRSMVTAIPWGISSDIMRSAFSRISSAAIWRIGWSVTVSSS